MELLTAEDEQRLWGEIQSGSRLAKEELFERNTRLVSMVLKKYHPNEVVSFEMMEVAGLEGLWKACGKFDPNKGRFSAIAVLEIRQALHQLFKASKNNFTSSTSDDGFIPDVDPDETFDTVYSLEKLSEYLQEDEWFVLQNKPYMTYKELGTKLSKGPRQIQRILARARTKARHPSISGVIIDF
ncbi:MAG: sigma-70 family RNA polymerase sigma factor [Candidatus Ancillula sp.]|jgi:RNA polymerase sigma factor (sigma-70 family)|nr:sigma-70 family RNA polymerase sigma factor [Candidatus Ancillula sp.]